MKDEKRKEIERQTHQHVGSRQAHERGAERGKKVRRGGETHK